MKDVKRPQDTYENNFHNSSSKWLSSWKKKVKAQRDQRDPNRFWQICLQYMLWRNTLRTSITLSFSESLVLLYPLLHLFFGYPLFHLFSCIYISFYGKMRLTLRNFMSKSICGYVEILWGLSQTRIELGIKINLFYRDTSKH